MQDPFDSRSSFCEPATKLCMCAVDKSVVTVVLPSDSSVQIHCMLNGCVVEDVRKGTISAFPRWVWNKCFGQVFTWLRICSWSLACLWEFFSLSPLCDWYVSFIFAQRLIDKKLATYASVTKSPSKEMCDIVFCQLPSGEMKGLLLPLIFYKKQYYKK